MCPDSRYPTQTHSEHTTETADGDDESASCILIEIHDRSLMGPVSITNLKININTDTPLLVTRFFSLSAIRHSGSAPRLNFNFIAIIYEIRFQIGESNRLWESKWVDVEREWKGSLNEDENVAQCWCNERTNEIAISEHFSIHKSFFMKTGQPNYILWIYY